jgi:hypothetical protein
LIGGKGFFCDHVSYQTDKEVIWEACSSCSQILHLIKETFTGWFREMVLRLPTFVNGLQIR